MGLLIWRVFLGGALAYLLYTQEPSCPENHTCTGGDIYLPLEQQP
jgi:hypothetical protein